MRDKKNGSIVKGIVLAKTVSQKSSKYFGRTWRIVDLINELATDTKYTAKDFNYATIREIADALEVPVRPANKRRRKIEC